MGYKRDYREVHEDLVGLYLSAILEHLRGTEKVLTNRVVQGCG